MAVKLSIEKVKVKNGIIGKRRKLDNPVEDLISSSGIRIKSYDKTQINIKRYLSSEDIRIFQDMPPELPLWAGPLHAPFPISAS